MTATMDDMTWNLPPGCTDRDIDEASPGYWDEPEDECEHEDYEVDILIGRATCNMCGHRWYQTEDEMRREEERQHIAGAMLRRADRRERWLGWWDNLVRRVRRWRTRDANAIHDDLPF